MLNPNRCACGQHHEISRLVIMRMAFEMVFAGLMGLVTFGQWIPGMHIRRTDDPIFQAEKE